MELVDGLDDHIQTELDRIRAELRVAIADSPYTFDEVALFAGIGKSTLYAILAGRHTTGGGLDTLLRVGYIVGARIELRAGVAPGFQVVPLDPTTNAGTKSPSRGFSTKSSARGADTAHELETARAKKAAKQRKGSAAAKRRNPGFSYVAA